MATIEEQLASDLGAVFDDFPCTFTHSSTAYSGTMSSLTKNRNLDEGGFFPEFDAIFELKVGDFSSLPVAGQKITLTTCFDATLKARCFALIQLNNPMVKRCG